MIHTYSVILCRSLYQLPFRHKSRWTHHLSPEIASHHPLTTVSWQPPNMMVREGGEEHLTSEAKAQFRKDLAWMLSSRERLTV